MTLTEKLPGTADPDALYDAFTLWTTTQGLNLYPAQEEALIEIVSGANVIQHPDRLGQEPGCHRCAFRRAGPGHPQLLHSADQGAGLGEVLRAVRVVRR